MSAIRNRLSGIRIPEIDGNIQGLLFTVLRQQKKFLRGEIPSVGRPAHIQSWKLQRHETDGKLKRCKQLSMDKNTIEDRISGLPCEILQFIISLLTMKEGAATSILSRRWRNLWSTSVSFLNFDLFNMIGYNYLEGFNQNFGILHCLRNDKMFLWLERYYFTQWVNRVLQLVHSSKINALRISFVLGKESASYLDRWITHAANQGLTQLELDFELRYLNLFGDAGPAYEFPFQLFGSLKYLRLTGCNFNYPPNFKGFNSLISLTLKECFLTEEGLENILSNCSFLEFMSLTCCQFHGCLGNLKISGPSLPLKHLRLHLTTPDAIKKIEVHDVNLISLEFTGYKTQLSIKNTPHLARLVIHTFTPVEILSNTPSLETLFLTAASWVKDSIESKLYVLKNIKRLVFLPDGDITDLLQVICLLEACPLLRKLELDMNIFRNLRTKSLTNITTIHGTLHDNLKEIEIYGFKDHPEKVEVIKYLLRNATALEKMEIFSIIRIYLGNGEWILYEQTVKQSRSLKKIRELLQKEAHPSTKLIVSDKWTNYLFPTLF